LSDTRASLQRKIASARKLQSVVRTMKAMAASSIGQYENAVDALEDYYHTVQLGLSAYFRQSAIGINPLPTDQLKAQVKPKHKDKPICAIVFGSDQGLVGQFNDTLADYVLATMAPLSGVKTLWTVGERLRSSMAARLEDKDLLESHSINDNSTKSNLIKGDLIKGNLVLGEHFTLPTTIGTITSLVGEVLTHIEAQRAQNIDTHFYLFQHQPNSNISYTPTSQHILPLDNTWRKELHALPWPTKQIPQVMDNSRDMLLALIKEYLFVSLFKACAESLTSENASRLAAMQRAEKNIGELLENTQRHYHQLRQSAIDEELFDLLSGFEALKESLNKS
jgi:F-type H+-transporting ATPase subunit gamma